MARAMATTVSTPLPQPISSCSPSRKLISSCSATSLPRESVSRVQIGLSIPRPSFRHICTWNGLKHLGISCRHRNRSRANKERYIGRIYASLFGVGAPEALVIGVVALLVFGPKGLAEVARNLGQTLRAFQPTIKELQDVSREFKSTLEREIGLDETQSPTNNSAYQSSVFNPQAGVNPNGNPSPKQPYPSEELASATLDSSSNAEPQGAPTLQTSEVANTTPTTVSSENSQGGDKP